MFYENKKGKLYITDKKKNQVPQYLILLCFIISACYNGYVYFNDSNFDYINGCKSVDDIKNFKADNAQIRSRANKYNKAQKEFMRYALLQEPKSALGKLVSEAWKKFKKWWDEKQRPEVEAEVRESVMGRLKELKQKTEVSKKVKVEPIKKKGIDR